MPTSDREREHGRRVDAREPIDEAWLGARCACACSTRWMMRASVESRAQPRDRDVERAAAVDRSGEHLVARPLLDRQRFARHRRLVDVARRRRDATVERDLLARPHHHDVADARPRRPAASMSAPSRRTSALRRREIHQRADRAARALHRARLEPLRQREEEDHGRRLAPLTEHHRAADGDEHQRR